MKLRMITTALVMAIIALVHAIAAGHDTWVQLNIPVVRVSDAIYIDLMLGNHGNDHRDFKLAGKTKLDGCTLDVIDPQGNRIDLMPSLIDQGYTANEGYWATSYRPEHEGLYVVAQTSDRVVHYAPTRSIKSAKSFFIASRSLDQVDPNTSGFDRVLGHPFELVPQTNPVMPMGPGQPITVQLLYKDQPLANARVSFIPRGVSLSQDFDPKYERMTDVNGMATYEPTDANYHLVVAHHADDQQGEGYTSTKYSATLTVIVPALCGCCGE